MPQCAELTLVMTCPPAVSTVVTAAIVGDERVSHFEISSDLQKGAPDWANYIKVICALPAPLCV